MKASVISAERGTAAKSGGSRNHVASASTAAITTAPRPPLVECAEREGLVIDFAGDDPGDQETRNDEEDVYADKAPGEPRQARVEGQHRQDRQRTKTVDIAAVEGSSGHFSARE
ncbi:MAG: hypothetical protein NTX28_00430 [Novosphingobium sp.]|nr:hypothetical protein [Novosphingobium sp.]